MKLGRKRPLAKGYRLALGNYLTRSLPTPPSACDYSPNALSALTPIFLNDQLGDCTAAGAFHISGLIIQNAGTLCQYNDDDVQRFYSATTGYNPADPSTDQGGDEVTVLNYWMQHGLIPGGSQKHQIAGWMTVNASDPVEVRAALWLFENLYFGAELPDAWLNPEPQGDGFIWDVAGPANEQNGHCFIGCSYDSTRIRIDSWGMLGWITDAAVAKYAGESEGGELYTVISQEAINKASQKAPNGFDWSQLVADFKSAGGNV